ncbi:MAG: ABC transporter ATP-binding protein [Actinobacteria bacterium]|nr:MAG: ABC transporter ATP-binding protein [Actinomycetota bacterium]
MRVHQPGGHLMRGRTAEVEDWSWNTTRRRLGVLWRLTRPYRVRTGFSVFSLLTATATALAPPFLAKYALDDAQNGHTGSGLWLVVGIFLAAGLANWGMTYVETYMTGWVGERILTDLRKQLFGHLQRLSLGFYERNRAGVLISRMTNDVEAIDQLVTDGVTTLAQSTLTLGGTAVLLLVLDWRLALATLAVIPFMSIGTVLFRKRSARAYAAVRERLGLVTATLAEDIAGMRMVQAFVREHRATENFRTVARRYRDANMETVVLNGVYFPFVSFLATLALAVVLGYGGHLYFRHAISIGTLFAFMLYVNNFFDPVQQLSQLYNTFLSATAALDKIIGVLDEAPEIVDRPGAQPLPHIQGHVRFEDVHFAYGLRGGELGEEVLHGIDLDVPAGTTVALVGHTGAGKSTIAKLLARFYEPTSGRLTIDGHDLNDVTQESLRHQLGIVPQEGFLFAGTVAENIAFGKPGARPEEIVRAAQTVGAHEFVLRLEDGYETHLGERGSCLSLGQRQLVAFARALLADPRILILDEATSSVDIGTERTIERALRTLLADRTSFVIAHRLSTIRDADLIVVLEYGRVIEQGSHEELLARRGLYTSLYGDWAAA